MLKRTNNLVFFGGRILGYQCLHLLLASDLKPALVVINPDDNGEDSENTPSLKKLAEENDILVKRLKQLTSEKGLKFLKSLSPSVGFCAFFSRIIPSSVIKNFDLGITNLHYSLLPEYRGQYPTVYAIFEGKKETGVTLHWISDQTDLGDIILQEKIKISTSDTGYSLFMKCLSKATIFFEKQIRFYSDNTWPVSIAQDREKAKNSPLRKNLPNNGQINWNWKGNKIRNFIRAMYFPPHNIAEFSIGNTNFEIRHKK